MVANRISDSLGSDMLYRLESCCLSAEKKNIFSPPVTRRLHSLLWFGI